MFLIITGHQRDKKSWGAVLPAPTGSGTAPDPPRSALWDNRWSIRPSEGENLGSPVRGWDAEGQDLRHGSLLRAEDHTGGEDGRAAEKAAWERGSGGVPAEEPAEGPGATRGGGEPGCPGGPTQRGGKAEGAAGSGTWSPRSERWRAAEESRGNKQVCLTGKALSKNTKSCFGESCLLQMAVYLKWLFGSSAAKIGLHHFSINILISSEVSVAASQELKKAPLIK